MREDITCGRITLEQGDKLLVCTDGLYSIADDIERSAEIVRNCPDVAPDEFKDDFTGLLVEI